MGIQPEYDGLSVKPVIPSGWQRFTAVRYFRGVRYEILVERKGNGKDVSLIVDGVPVKGSVIPIPPENVKTIKITAYIG